VVAIPVISCIIRVLSGVALASNFCEDRPMKPEIHPKYEEITATCSCGNVMTTKSTICEDIHLDVCSHCHPFYTGQQKVIDTAGRIDRFNKRFGSRRRG